MGYKRIYQKLLEKIKERVIKSYGKRLVSCVVFGSVANDTFSPESDIDLLIVLESSQGNYKDYTEFYEKIEEKIKPYLYNIEVNPIIIAKDKLTVNIPLLWHTSFIILYDKDNFFNNFIKELEAFKNTHLIYHKKSTSYIEIKNG